MENDWPDRHYGFICYDGLRSCCCIPGGIIPYQDTIYFNVIALSYRNGVFGGMVPFIATLITTIPNTNYLSGLWYPIVVALLCLIIGGLYLSNKLVENSH